MVLEFVNVAEGMQTSRKFTSSEEIVCQKSNSYTSYLLCTISKDHIFLAGGFGCRRYLMQIKTMPDHQA